MAERHWLAAPAAALASPRQSVGGVVMVASLVVAGCGSPTEPGETVFLEGQLSAQGSETHVVVLQDSGVTTIAVEDLRKVLWDVTLGGSETVPSIALGVGAVSSGECVITGRLVAREGELYLWSLEQGAQCFEIADSGIIPADGLLAYAVRLELPQ